MIAVMFRMKRTIDDSIVASARIDGKDFVGVAGEAWDAMGALREKLAEALGDEVLLMMETK